MWAAANWWIMGTQGRHGIWWLYPGDELGDTAFWNYGDIHDPIFHPWKWVSIV